MEPCRDVEVGPAVMVETADHPLVLKLVEVLRNDSGSDLVIERPDLTIGSLVLIKNQTKIG